jgi:2-polyprenyl-6-methoxyphenol hydroxylase-like FAD-dependent oxidoreductase
VTAKATATTPVASKRGHVEIAGAGIVGLTAAMALAKRGWSVRVHERNAELREIGAGLTLWVNGMHVLREIGVLDKLTVGDGSAALHKWTLIDERGRTLQSADDLDAVTFLRLHMHRQMVEHAYSLGIEIVTSSPVKGATRDGQLILEDGSWLDADVVIGADGVHSAVREHLALAEQITNLGDGCVRFIVDRKPGEMDDHFIEHWDGSRRIGILPTTDGMIYIYGCCAAKDTAARTSVDAWAESFPGYADLLRRVATMPGYNTFHEVRLQKWSAGKVALVGDAANAMSANLGLAANLGIVNAFSLAQAIDGYAEISRGLEAWEASERSFTDSAQSYSRAYTKIVCNWPRPMLDARSALVWGMGRSNAVKKRVRVHPAVRRIPNLAPERSAAAA